MRPSLLLSLIAFAASLALAGVSLRSVEAYQHIANGGFEAGGQGWTTDSATDLTIDAASARSGGAGARLAGSGKVRMSAALPQLLGKLSAVDLVVVEGFKRGSHPKLEVHRAAVGKPLLHPDDPHIVAIASDVALPAARVPVIALDDVDAVADLVLAHAALVASVLGAA